MLVALQQLIQRFVPISDRQWGAAQLLSHARRLANAPRGSRLDRGVGNDHSIEVSGALSQLLLYDLVERSALANSVKEGALAYMRARLFSTLSGAVVAGPDFQGEDGATSLRIETKTFDSGRDPGFFMINDAAHSRLSGQCDGYLAVLCPPYARHAYVTSLIPYSDVSRWELRSRATGSPARCYPIDELAKRYCSRSYQEILQGVRETYDAELIRHLAGRRGPGSIAAQLAEQLPEIVQLLDIILDDGELFPRTESFLASAIPEASLTESRIVRLSPSVRLLRSLSKGAAALDELSPGEFEKLIATLLEKDGYTIKHTGGRDDGGVDVHAEKDLGSHGLFKAVWQAKKRSLPGKVGLSFVRELADTRLQFNASKGIIVTSSYLTRGALERINRERYTLGKVDRDDLDSWIRRVLLEPR